MVDVQRPGAPVVVGIDGSASALEATRWAAREADRRRVGLRLMSAFGWRATGHIGDPGFDAGYREVMLRSTRADLAEAGATAAEATPGIEVTEEVVDGFPVPLLVAVSRKAQLVVIGDRGLGGFTGLLIGSVAVELAAHASSPVVVVRGDQAPADAPVVVGIDGSPTSEAALAFAFDAAAARYSPLVAVHTWNDYVLDAAVSPLLDWDAIESDEHQLLAERLAGWGEKYPDIEVRRVVARDRPAHALLEQSAGAQLLVVGSRGRGGFTGLLLGSVSHAVLHHSPCPVAIVRPSAVDEAR